MLEVCRCNAVEGSGVGNHVVRCFGLSSILLIGVLTIWGGLPLGALTQLGLSEILKYWSIPLSIALGLALCIVLLKRKKPTVRLLSAGAVLAGLFVLGGYALLFVGLDGIPRVLVAVFSSALVGIGYGLFSLLWQQVLSQLSFDDMTKTLLLSLAMGSAEYLFYRQLSALAYGRHFPLSLSLRWFYACLRCMRRRLPQTADRAWMVTEAPCGMWRKRWAVL